MRLVALALVSCDASDGADPGPLRPPSTETTPSSSSSSSSSPSDTSEPAFDCEPITGDGPDFYEDNPTYPDPVPTPWSSASPADVDLDAALLGQAADALAELPFTWSFLVIRHNQLVWESYFHDSASTASNNVHSASKSILSALVGIAAQEGALALDDRVGAHLPDRYADLVGEPGKAEITVRHLLNMTPGLSWREDRTEYQIQQEDDWVGAILAQDLVRTPGEQFVYSTGDTHLLSAVLTEATGETTCAYAHRMLFGPLGIAAEHWARDPQGVYSGGYNVYLTPRELARFGLLALRGGTWDGVELLPAGYLAEATAPQVDAGDGYGYGLGWWTYPIGGYDAAVAWGFGGQLAYVIPEVDLVVAITTDTRDFGVDFDAEPLLERFVLPAVLR